MTHARYQEALALFALGTLDPAESEAIRRHVERCASCARALAEFEETAASLAYTAPLALPSEDCTRRILEAEPVGLLPTYGPATRATGRRWRSLRVGAELAAAAAVVALITVQIGMVRRLDEASAAVRRIQEVGAFVTSPDVEIVALWGTPVAPGAHAKLAYERQSGRAMLFPSRLAPLPRGKAYQLWAVGDRVRPVGILSPEAFGAVVRDSRAAEAAGSRVFIVTRESARGAESPRGDVVLTSRPLDP